MREMRIMPPDRWISPWGDLTLTFLVDDFTFANDESARRPKRRDAKVALPMVGKKIDIPFPRLEGAE
jgi:hypothetical protein